MENLNEEKLFSKEYEEIILIHGEDFELEGIGVLKAKNILEYYKNINKFNVLSITLCNWLQQIPDEEEDKKIEMKKLFKNFDVLTSSEIALLMAMDMIDFCFDETCKIKKVDGHICIGLSNGNIINRDNYDYVRDKIIKFYGIVLPEQAESGELQMWFDKDRRRKAKEGNDLTISDIISTIACYCKWTYKYTKTLTPYQINYTLKRIQKIKQFDFNSILAPHVDGKKFKIGSYLEHIEMLDNIKHGKDLNDITGALQQGDVSV